MKIKTAFYSLVILLALMWGCQKDQPTQQTEVREYLETFIKLKGKIVFDDGTVFESNEQKVFRLPQKYWAYVDRTLEKPNDGSVDYYIVFVSSTVELTGSSEGNEITYYVTNYGNFSCNRTFKVQGQVYVNNTELSYNELLIFATYFDEQPGSIPDIVDVTTLFYPQPTTGQHNTALTAGQYFDSNSPYTGLDVVTLQMVNYNASGMSVFYNSAKTRLNVSDPSCD